MRDQVRPYLVPSKVNQTQLFGHDTEPIHAAAGDWAAVESSLNDGGYALMPAMLTSAQCAELVAMYTSDTLFRSRIVMERHGFGRGEYKYFAYPLPTILAHLRADLYRNLAPIANRWNERTGVSIRYPEVLSAFLDRCHTAGQTRPTPLILK
jgi:hypothetical protein